MSRLEEFQYQGEELDIFAHAVHWKKYWAGQIERWIHGDVLEVGAGLGHNTALLQTERVTSWYCLEPDRQLMDRLAVNVSPVRVCTIANGTIASVTGRSFDTILYIDVLEHIAEDRREVAAAAELLRPNGHLIVLAPAHNFLFTEFDAAIGHVRRYDKALLRACTPPGCRLETLFYLDSAGILLSLANRLLLRQKYPTLRQIKTWDSLVVPVSRLIDPVLQYTLGKTIVGVWTRSL